jgi:hypothetical protein
MKRIACLLVAILAATTSSARADLQINELYFSPEDPKEDRQFFEIFSTTGATSLSGVWLLEIEGDKPIDFNLDNQGMVLNAFDLSAYSTGTNGLFLYQGSNTVIDTDPVAPGVQGPAAATTVVRSPFGPGPQSVSDPQIFGYELEDEVLVGTELEEVDIYINNVHSFLLVQGFTGAVGLDLDADDNGVLDSPLPWSSVHDGISQAESGDLSNGHQYAGQVGGLNVGLDFGADAYVRGSSDGKWMFFDSGSGEDEDAGYPGPFFANDPTGPDAAFEDGTIINVTSNSEFLFVTPGAGNLQVPEPSSLILAACCGLLAFNRRR